MYFIVWCYVVVDASGVPVAYDEDLDAACRRDMQKICASKLFGEKTHSNRIVALGDSATLREQLVSCLHPSVAKTIDDLVGMAALLHAMYTKAEEEIKDEPDHFWNYVLSENAHHEFGKHLDRLVTMFEVADVQIDRLDSL